MMKTFLLAPDSFKETLSAVEVCDILRDGILRHFPDARVLSCPISDGGEGMAKAYRTACGGSAVTARVTGPLGAPTDAVYTLLPDGTAVIEMASAAGLALAWGSAAPESPMHATTYGVGELLRHAQAHGARCIVLGLGGSATCDGGIGMAAALGYRFLDAAGQPVTPDGAGLARLASIRPPEGSFPLPVRAACDVDNPLCGPSGSAAVFGPQKGARPEEVAQLDAGLAQLARCIRRDLGIDVLNVPGAGAAGGLGAGVLAFLRGTLEPGIELLLDACHFDQLAAQADLVLTGEGRFDAQSLRGKAPVGVARRASRAGVPCLALCGCVAPGVAAEALGFTAVFSALQEIPADFAALQRQSRANLAALTDNVMALLKLSRSSSV